MTLNRRTYESNNRRRWALAFALLATSCGGGGGTAGSTNIDGGADAATDDSGGGYEFSGGVFYLPECGYSITSRDEAGIAMRGTPSLGMDPKPIDIHLGLAGDYQKAADPKTSMVIMWRTGDDTTLATTVQYGTGGMTDQSYEGVTFRYDTPNRNPVRMHEAHLCGLTADTTYTYRVGGKDATSSTESWSDVYTFHTAPSSPDTLVVIAVLGDTRDGYSKWGQMLQQADTLATPDIVFFSGDSVTLGPVQSDWDDWFSEASAVLNHVPLMGSHGNHDVNSVNYFSQFAFPGNEEDYSLDYGSFHLTVLNDTPVNPADVEGVNAQFLENDLTASDSSPWKFLMHHRPMWSAAAAHGGDPALLAAWGPSVDKHKLDFVFNGHDHDYERTKPMRGMNPEISASQGTTFMVAGSAGAPLYDSGTGAWTAFSKSTFNMAIIKVRKGQLDMKAYDDSGNVLDSMSVSK